MNKLSVKIGIALLPVLFALYYLVPSIVQFMPEQSSRVTPFITKYFPKSHLKLGLDLQGGTYLVLSVDLEKAVIMEYEKQTEFLRSHLKDNDIQFTDVTSEGYRVAVTFPSMDMGEKMEVLLRDKGSLFIKDDEETLKRNNGSIVVKLSDAWEKDYRHQIVAQAIETIRNRIDEFGVSEPTIQSQGENRIVIQLPGEKDSARALSIIKRTALLEFKMVDRSLSPGALEQMINDKIIEGTLPKDAKAADVNVALVDKLPKDTQVLFEIKTDPSTNAVRRTPWLIKNQTLLTGGSIADARVRQDPTSFNPYYVQLQFDKEGAVRFDQITGDHVGEELAIVLDGNVTSAPRISERIPSGSARITLGSGTDAKSIYEEAKDLVVVLRAGALPAPVVVEENRTVGPSLGKDSIETGKMSAIVSIVLIFIFMIIYYRVSGLVADFALVLNMLFILALMAAFGATLTLPGIAGLVLTIGMAVDANVLVNERMREESRSGKNEQTSVVLGYDRANLTIIDASLTTLISGIVLYQFGTGPIQGFAVTLMIGLFTSYITAMWYTKIIVKSLSTFRKGKYLSF